MRKLSVLILSIFVSIGLIPIGLYWWGLNNVHSYPMPSKTELNVEKKQELWQMYHGYGKPRIEGVTPYGYILYTYCQINHGMDSEYCFGKYPGLMHAAFSVKLHLMQNIDSKRNLHWQLSWMSYTIWASNNWNIDQILNTLGNEPNT